MANQSGTVTSAQGRVTITGSPNDVITFTPTAATYTVEYPIGTANISGATTTQTLTLSVNTQCVIWVASGSVAWSLVDNPDATSTGGGLSSLNDVTTAATAASAAERLAFAEAAEVAPVLAPVSLSGTTTLTAADHGNRQIIFSGASANLTIANDAGGGWSADDSVEVHTATGSAGVPTIITPDGKSVTGSATKIIGATRKGADSWTTGTTDPAASGAVGSSIIYALAAPIDYTLTATTTDVTGSTLTIPANTWKTGGLLRMTILTKHKTGTTAYNVRVRSGTTSIRASLTINATNGNVYSSHAEVFNLGSNTQISTQSTGGAAAEITNGTASSYTFDTTAGIDFKVALDGTAGDVVTICGFVIELLNPA